MHIPVLREEVIFFLNPGANQSFIDCTVGEGGHTLEILKRNGPEGKVLGIDWDKEMIERTEQKFERWPELKKRLKLVVGSFADLEKIAKENEMGCISGILLDIGFSLTHIKESGRGFSFLKEEPLIMRYDWPSKRQVLTAHEIVNIWPREEIEQVLKKYGEEKFYKQIAGNIVQSRKQKGIETTFDLVKLIRNATPSWYHHQRIHPATKTFQALRIEVNQELENLERALEQALRMLTRDGVIVVISFHSLEDRIVKNFFKKAQEEKKLKIITKKPVRASEKERRENPSSGSARLRAAKKISL